MRACFALLIEEASGDTSTRAETDNSLIDGVNMVAYGHENLWPQHGDGGGAKQFFFLVLQLLTFSFPDETFMVFPSGFDCDLRL